MKPIGYHHERRSEGLSALVCFALAVLHPIPASSQTGARKSLSIVDQDGEKPEVVEVRGERIESYLTPAPDQTLSLGDRFARQETLGDVLGEFGGVSLFRSGAAGSVQLLSLRGSDFDQTQLLIDDVPVVGPDRGAIDYGLFPIDGFERIELYTFSAPIRYGLGSIGGVIRLVPREATEKRARVRGSMGSFGSRRAEIEIETRAGPLAWVAAGSFLRARNNFEYLDNNSTFAIESDDTIRQRQNADVDQANGFSYLTWENGAHRVAVLGLLVHQDQGVPGPATIQSLESRQKRTRAFGSLGYRYRGEISELPIHAFATLGGGRDRDRFVDLLARVGVGREDTRDRYNSVDSRAGVFFDLTPFWTLGTVGSGRWDRIAPNNAFSSPPEEPSQRRSSVIAAESLLHGETNKLVWKLRASASSQSIVAELSESRLQSTFDTRTDRRDPLYRLEAELAWAPCVKLSAKMTNGVDYPTTLQLFGNRNTIVGNLELRPERSSAFELNAETELAIDALGARFRASVYTLNVDDIVVARRSSNGTVSFLNERQGETRGFESMATFEWDGWLRSDTALSIQNSVFDNRGFERVQSLRVPKRIFQRISATHDISRTITSVLVFGELNHRSGFFADSANLIKQPALTVFHAGLQASSRFDLSLALSVRNVLNGRGMDLIAFPLPGRSFELSLEWRIPV